ncbi:hypothetical protein Salat_2417900 [Sesamum alatum]|uniref:Uncharacterized protein n=1 Tax=Sesamum alatum TaxID=300844 RepID=A0AAE2CFD7_9LAMI|nr:hypothetical protein Salat_2417900 [Sesamum alatum]
MYRMDMLCNQSSATIELVEIPHLAPPGRHGRRILLQPRSHRVFPAAEFYTRNRYSGRPSTILVYVDGRKVPQALTPQQFMRYVKITFDVDREGRVTITGVEPKLTDLCRFW